MINPDQLFECAEALAKAQTNESCARAAVSRAYYSVYHACIAAIPSKKTSKETGKGMHQSYLDELLNSRDTTVCFIGRKLSELYQQRVKADYALNQTITFSEAYRAIEIARRLFEVIKTELH